MFFVDTLILVYLPCMFVRMYEIHTQYVRLYIHFLDKYLYVSTVCTRMLSVIYFISLCKNGRSSCALYVFVYACVQITVLPTTVPWNTHKHTHTYSCTTTSPDNNTTCVIFVIWTRYHLYIKMKKSPVPAPLSSWLPEFIILLKNLQNEISQHKWYDTFNINYNFKIIH